MASKTFDIDGEAAAFETRMKALAKERDDSRAETRDRIGALAVATGIPHGRTAENLAGCFLWAKQQARANPGLDKEWDRLGATFLSKSRTPKKDTAADRDATGQGAGDAVPASTGKPDRRSDAGADDLLARSAAE